MRLRTIFAVALPIVAVSILSLLFFNSPFAKGANNYTETTTYFLTDHLGSIDVIMDDQGKVTERADYLPFGSDRLRITSTTGPTTGPSTEYKFTGKELDDETGLMYYGARYYDSAIGRFISFDPLLLNEGGKPLSSVLSNPQELNPYSYVINNPIKFVDPNGEWGVATDFGGIGHQILTRAALEMANVDEQWRADHQSNLIYGASIYADLSVKLTKLDIDNSLHSTRSNNVSNANEQKALMMKYAKSFFQSNDDREFGRLLHMVQDSYCPSHTARDADGNITAFYDYSQQDKSKHMDGDNINNANIESLYGAVSATMTLMKYRSNPDSKWSDVRKYLNNSVFKLAKGATIDTPGDKYKKEDK